MDYKIILSVLSIAIQLTGFFIYFRGVYKGKTKPHAFTWLVWTILSTIGFFATLTSEGYAVAWILGINVLGCGTTSAIGFYQKRVDYDKYDWLALIGALVGTLLWYITNNALYAVILISISDFIAITPTLRKAYKFPFEENLESFLIGIIFYIFAIIALESFELTNWLYPASIIFADLVLIGIIIIQRRKKVLLNSSFEHRV